MIDIDWKKDYKGDFICYKCEQSKLVLGGFRGKNKLFLCPYCKACISSSINLKRRSQHLKLNLEDKGIDWNREYQGEFACPTCNSLGMKFKQRVTKKNGDKCVRFICPNPSCKQIYSTFHSIRIEPISDPVNPNIVWYTNQKIKDFVCLKCKSKNIYFDGIKDNKVQLKCRNKECKASYQNSLELKQANISRKTTKTAKIKTFNFDLDKWDLRGINNNFDLQTSGYTANFENINLNWLKKVVKQYILYRNKAGFKITTIINKVNALKSFCIFLEKKDIKGFHQIDRNLILDYLTTTKGINEKLATLQNFFTTGRIKGWFEIDPDIIRHEDYPKQNEVNPDPLSDIVREQIEQNLYIIPDPIARMWIICFFAAMRPNELALLKKDCLVQEGEHWKLVWERKKTDDFHSVPISRAIAKVVQEQQEYIQSLWGNEWDYLFCHYQGLSSKDSSQPNIKPVKKVIPQNDSPLTISIRTLIKDLDIRDENGQLATFQTKLLRSTRLTQLFEKGHDLAVVSAWAGHKRLATTSTYYTKVSCDLIEQEVGNIQKALVNSEGHRLFYESYPKSFWETPQAHKLELSGTHINTPIYGYCGLDLDQDCHKFRACYTCNNFVATVEKLPQYIKTRDQLRGKQSKALANGQDVLVEQFGSQADQLDKIIVSLQEAA